jgi:type IV pilus assembly protein PilA
MIVIAIVGILAAVALPLYQGYTKRSKAAELVLALSGCRTAISEVYQSTASSPGPNNWGCEESAARSRYVASLRTDVDGLVTATAQNIDAADIDGKEVELIPYVDDVNPMSSSLHMGKPVYKWLCGPALGPTGMPWQFLPASCRD